MMRSLIPRLLIKGQKSSIVLEKRCLTTFSDPKKSSELAYSVREVNQQKGEIQYSKHPDIDFPRSDFFTYIFKDVKLWQHKTFAECAITGRSYTFGQTIDGALRWATAIKKLVPNSPRPTVAFLSINSPEYVIMFFGCFAAGAILTPINPTFTPNEIAYQLKDSEAELIVVDAIVEPLVDAALKHLGKSIPVVINGVSNCGRPNAQEIFFNPTVAMHNPTNIDPDSIGFLPYSSGTTGRPKGVKLSHQAIVSNNAMLAEDYMTTVKKTEGDRQDTQLGILPMFHIFGLSACMFNSAYFGARLLMMPKFDPEVFVTTLKKNRIPTIKIVPQLVQFINNCPMLTKEDLPGLKTLTVGGAPLPISAAMAFKEKFPGVVLQPGYGLTEALLTHGAKKDLNNPLGAYCGGLLANSKAKVVDIETGEILPPNTPGALWVHTPSVMAGYHNNETATKDTLDEEGYLNTGDIATYSEDGMYSIVGRAKELIKVKGLQVSPIELEETIQSCPGVAEVGVVGIPHPQFGEAPAAFIVKSDPDLSERTIHAHMKEQLSKHKQLEGGITFVSELPKNTLGKLLRRVLKEMASK